MRIQVVLWGETVGYLKQGEGGQIAFQYTPKWLSYGIELSPIRMPLSLQPYSFPDLIGTKTFAGLPGLIADALPEKFGNSLLKTYLAEKGRSFEDLTPLERLSYLGNRGMGALEFRPDNGKSNLDNPQGQGYPLPTLDIEILAAIADEVLHVKKGLKVQLDSESLESLVQIGTSAGGAKAKAVIGWNRETNSVVAGQSDLPQGYEHWLLKFDAIDNEEHATSKNIGRIEYAYALMASDGCGIDMNECRLFETPSAAHFMTKRFDRDNNAKFHVQSFAGLDHADRDPVGQYGYEELFLAMKKMGLPQSDLTEMYRRMVFNIIARNQDDHTKNHAFIMDASGEWRLSPAFDLCFSYKVGNPYIEQHQMRCNNKRTDFTRDDVLSAASVAGVKRPGEIIDEVCRGVQKWSDFADRAGLPEPHAREIQSHFRVSLGEPDPLNTVYVKKPKLDL